jgi:hypothetical protein
MTDRLIIKTSIQTQAHPAGPPPFSICILHISYFHLHPTSLDGNEAKDLGPKLLSWGEMVVGLGGGIMIVGASSWSRPFVRVDRDGGLSVGKARDQLIPVLLV